MSDLRAELTTRNLSTVGRKAELLDRLQACLDFEEEAFGRTTEGHDVPIVTTIATATATATTSNSPIAAATAATTTKESNNEVSEGEGGGGSDRVITTTTKSAATVATGTITTINKATKTEGNTGTGTSTDVIASTTTKEKTEVKIKQQLPPPPLPPPPPKKKKKVAAKTKTKRMTFQDELIQKMIMTCRPYAMKELVQLMGKSTNEASINFCLLTLIDKNWVIKKEFQSKSRSKELYWANQECSDPNLWKLECLQVPSQDDIHATRTELATLQRKQKIISRDIELVHKTPSNEQLIILCEQAEQEVQQLQQKLEAVQNRISSSASSSANPKSVFGGGGGGNRLNNNNKNVHTVGKKKKTITKPQLTPLQLKKRINKMRDQWKKRKVKCMDFVESLADGMEKKVKDVIHKVLALETDEMEDVKLPAVHITV